jgi:uncharacterized protein (TIGR02452 family)
VANETLDIAHDGHYSNRKGKVVDVSEALINSIQNSVHYHSSHEFSTPPQEAHFDTTHFYVEYGSSLEIAAQLKAFCDEQQHIGILNSASSKTPSKFLRGTLSQEECICRASLLFPCLAQFEAKPHHFYVINNKPKYQKSASSCAIFSPKVPVIRCDSSAGELLFEPHECSFVSICAPKFDNAFLEEIRTIPHLDGGAMETPSLFLQEGAHLLSLLSAVAMSTLRTDVMDATPPLVEHIPGRPWPPVDPDNLCLLKPVSITKQIPSIVRLV